jgi:GntR family transcriptional regulator, transcriptional repressor for pyruvate dehydrogenase complex
MALKRTTLVGATVEELLHLIEARQLSAGDTLPSTAEIAEELDVSRTVVREAIAELAGQGLLVRRQGKDTAISFPGHAEFERLLRLRKALVSDDTRELSEFVQAQLSAAARLTASRVGSPAGLAEDIASLESARTAEAAVDVEEALLSRLAQSSGNDLFGITIDGSASLLRPVRLATWAHWLGSGTGARDAVAELRVLDKALASGDGDTAGLAISRYCQLTHQLTTQPVALNH